MLNKKYVYANEEGSGFVPEVSLSLDIVTAQATY
jgi:hypothetical protein